MGHPVIGFADDIVLLEDYHDFRYAMVTTKRMC